MPFGCNVAGRPTRLSPALGPRRRRRLFLVTLLACLAGSLAVAAGAGANAIAPESGGSPNANSLHSLYVVLLVIAALIVAFWGRLSQKARALALVASAASVGISGRMSSPRAIA